MARAIERPRHIPAARIAGACLLTALCCAIGIASPVRASEPTSELRKTPGCETLEANLLRDPEPNVRMELAECYAQLGRSASAWAQYREAAVAARDVQAADLERTARTRAKALESELSYVTVNTWKGQEVMVTQDGWPIDATVLGTAIPLDPGWHVIAASAAGKRGWSKRIELGSHGDHVKVSVPVLPDDVNLVAELSARPPSVAPVASASDNSSVQRTLALVAGAVGIAGVATGTLFGVKAASDWSDTKSQCRAFPYCGEDGARLAKQAKASALISTIGFAAGIAGLSGGALLWFTAPSAEQTTTSVGLGVGNVSVRGSM